MSMWPARGHGRLITFNSARDAAGFDANQKIKSLERRSWL
jgi:hypothetical protein